MIGKLNGVIPAHTPSGCRNECRSTSVETWSENSPLVSSAIPHANSTTSMPRTTSPLASSTVLPCSAEMIRASSSVCCDDQLAEGEHDPRAAHRPTRRSTSRTRPSRPARRRRRRRARRAARAAAPARWRGRRRARCGVEAPAVGRPPMRGRWSRAGRCSRCPHGLWGLQVGLLGRLVALVGLAGGAGRVERRDLATGTSHHASDDGAATSGSVSICTTVVTSDATASRNAVSNSSIVDEYSARAPRLAAFAARSTGSVSSVPR